MESLQGWKEGQWKAIACQSASFLLEVQVSGHCCEAEGHYPPHRQERDAEFGGSIVVVWLFGLVGGGCLFFCFCALDKKEKYKSRIRLIRGVIAFLPYSGLFGWCGLVFLGLLSLWFAG